MSLSIRYNASPAAAVWVLFVLNFQFPILFAGLVNASLRKPPALLGCRLIRGRLFYFVLKKVNVSFCDLLSPKKLLILNLVLSSDITAAYQYDNQAITNQTGFPTSQSEFCVSQDLLFLTCVYLTTSTELPGIC